MKVCEMTKAIRNYPGGQTGGSPKLAKETMRGDGICGTPMYKSGKC